MLPWFFTKWLQEKFRATLYFQITDDEKFLFKDFDNLEEATKVGYENILDIIAMGFDPKLTKIFLDTEYIRHLYPIAVEVAKRITFSTTQAVFGFENSNNIGEIFYTSIQAAPAFLPIPQGDVAFTLPTNEQQGVGGYIAAGDYIDIVATVNTSVVNSTNPKIVTATVFRHVHVLRVGPPVDTRKGGQQQGVSSSLTVVLSECDAKVLDWLIANANLRYLLESYKDYQPATAPAAEPCVATGVIGPQQVDAQFQFTKG